MGPANNSKDDERASSAARTDEQRQERNSKGRESYKRNKGYANKKENERDGNANDSDAGINSKSTQDHTGDRILSDLKSNEQREERNRKRREAYRMKKDESQTKNNKENAPDVNTNASDAGIISNLSQDHAGMSWHLIRPLTIFIFPSFIIQFLNALDGY
ncbi:cyclin-L1-1-like [Panicum virgatum]|uniref:cyclin-L1-1-like n=1 Tax=Panicum virgatum TaxID=38727 RepID=UPI0019D59F9B|nr:cyclin-L1-1-like [Panicum virgatum]